MRYSLALVLLGAAIATASERTASIYIQPVTTPSVAPTPLASVQYDPSSSSSEAEIVAYESPDLPASSSEDLARIGIYDPATSSWTSSTSVTSVSNFEKAYAPHFVVTVGQNGEVLGVSARGVKIDAGHTRDFGPRAQMVVSKTGKQPDLNRPVVISPEGRRAAEVEEKSFLQKYWWVLAIGAVLVMTGGGEGK